MADGSVALRIEMVADKRAMLRVMLKARESLAALIAEMERQKCYEDERSALPAIRGLVSNLDVGIENAQKFLDEYGGAPWE